MRVAMVAFVGRAGLGGALTGGKDVIGQLLNVAEANIETRGDDTALVDPRGAHAHRRTKTNTKVQLETTTITTIFV
eukprot:2290534-Amphidinium_carterae.1